MVRGASRALRKRTGQGDPMRRHGRRFSALLVALAATWAMAALSRVPYDATSADHALIRLSWRTTGEFVDECRRSTPEELERLPVHMRREVVCEGRMVPYHLRVTLDGRVVAEETVRAAGARQDRPLYVHREIRVAPGEYHLAIVWERDDDPSVEATAPGSLVTGPADPTIPVPDEPAETGTSASGGTGSSPGTATGSDRTDGPAVGDGGPAFEGRLRLEAGEVALVTYDPDRRVFVARGPASRATP